jgi:hypothetical protein
MRSAQCLSPCPICIKLDKRPPFLHHLTYILNSFFEQIPLIESQLQMLQWAQGFQWAQHVMLTPADPRFLRNFNVVSYWVATAVGHERTADATDGVQGKVAAVPWQIWQWMVASGNGAGVLIDGLQKSTTAWWFWMDMDHIGYVLQIDHL